MVVVKGEVLDVDLVDVEDITVRVDEVEVFNVVVDAVEALDTVVVERVEVLDTVVVDCKMEVLETVEVEAGTVLVLDTMTLLAIQRTCSNSVS